jgi:hypothetical protein
VGIDLHAVRIAGKSGQAAGLNVIPSGKNKAFVSPRTEPDY